ncbi:hypothetical protein [Actinomadura fibrosa]|uniref:Uncharacterized protein n=1 Tax=Actinomadura fibrosa TaxID=111802 RepID=A0ABW2XHS5_9ACTN|nr:hypothetical protein [Actinomadura fibrosa]
MALESIGIDPETDKEHCPAVFVDRETGDLVFQGWTVAEAETLRQVAAHSPIAADESVVRLPTRMAPIVREALAALEADDGGAAAVR